MGRIFTKLEYNTRWMLNEHISYLQEDLNRAIAKAIADGYEPDVCVKRGPLMLSGQRQPLEGRLWDLEQPRVEVSFFRDDDSMAHE